MDIDPGYDKISDEELDTLVQQYHQETSGGHAYIIGCLHAAHSLCVQCHCVIASMTCINHLGQGL